MSQIQSWYEIAKSGELRQGSILRAFPVAKPPENIVKQPGGKFIPAALKVKERDVIVLTQSCDLANKGLELVLVCPLLALTTADGLAGKTETGELIKNNPELLGKFREQMRRGYQPSLHMLSACTISDWEKDIQVIDFRLALTVSHNHLKTFVADKESHLRLCSPFREHLSQAYARFLMRVGMPSETDIPSFSRLP